VYWTGESEGHRARAGWRTVWCVLQVVWLRKRGWMCRVRHDWGKAGQRRRPASPMVCCVTTLKLKTMG